MLSCRLGDGNGYAWLLEHIQMFLLVLHAEICMSISSVSAFVTLIIEYLGGIRQV